MILFLVVSWIDPSLEIAMDSLFWISISGAGVSDFEYSLPAPFLFLGYQVSYVYRSQAKGSLSV